jgi:hypothetical protein
MELLIYSAGVVTLVPLAVATTISFAVNFGAAFGGVIGRAVGAAAGAAVVYPFALVGGAIPRLCWGARGGGRIPAASLVICDDGFVLV